MTTKQQPTERKNMKATTEASPDSGQALASVNGSALLSDLAELTLLACTIRHNAREMRTALDRMDKIADMLEANRARLKAQTNKVELPR